MSCSWINMVMITVVSRLWVWGPPNGAYTSHLTPDHTPYTWPHTSHLTLYLTPQNWPHLTPDQTPHTSHLTSHLTPHTWPLSFHLIETSHFHHNHWAKREKILFMFHVKETLHPSAHLWGNQSDCLRWDSAGRNVDLGYVNHFSDLCIKLL